MRPVVVVGGARSSYGLLAAMALAGLGVGVPLNVADSAPLAASEWPEAPPSPARTIAAAMPEPRRRKQADWDAIDAAKVRRARRNEKRAREARK